MFKTDAVGGISFRTPIFQFGNTTPDINSGYSFDLPMATIQSFSNQALSFTQNNAAINQGFLGGVITNAQDNVNKTSDRAFATFDNVSNTMLRITQEQGRTVRAIHEPRKCFITTAICESSGKPDDCYELTEFRKLRDEYMLKDNRHKKLVDRYYEIAPDIVEGINARPNSDRIYERLNKKYLFPALEAIKNGQFERAVMIYRSMVNYAVRYRLNGVAQNG